VEVEEVVEEEEEQSLQRGFSQDYIIVKTGEQWDWAKSGDGRKAKKLENSPGLSC
jgi:hypothetical protein